MTLLLISTNTDMLEPLATSQEQDAQSTPFPCPGLAGPMEPSPVLGIGLPIAIGNHAPPVSPAKWPLSRASLKVDIQQSGNKVLQL